MEATAQPSYSINGTGSWYINGCIGMEQIEIEEYHDYVIDLGWTQFISKIMETKNKTILLSLLWVGINSNQLVVIGIESAVAPGVVVEP